MSAVLGVVVGVSFMMLVLSLLSSALVEGVAGFFRLRASMLERALYALLAGAWERRQKRPADAATPQSAAFFADPTLTTGSPIWLRKTFRASYVPTDHFVDLVFTHYLGGVRTDPATVHERIGALEARRPDSLDALLPRLWAEAGHDVSALRARLGRHYDDTMDRVSGWYRRRTRWMLFGLGVVLAVGFNVGLFSMVRTLWTDTTVRAGLEAAARQSTAPSDLTTNVADAGTALRRASEQGLPVGWGNRSAPSGGGGWVAAAFGWLAVGVGVSFGAPFWFDVLGRFANLRLAGPAPGRATSPGTAVGTVVDDRVAQAPAAIALAPTDAALPATDGPVLTAFDPAVHGFHFDNDFENRFPQPFGSMNITTYGRCGGMVYAGLDLFGAQRPVPATTSLPADDTPLARYLLARLFDSWANTSAARFLTWTLADDAWITQHTHDELAALYAHVDRGEPAPLGLISARKLADVGYCHQVLAIGYDRRPDGTVVVHTWDNNHADVVTTLTVTPGRVGVVSNQRTNPYRGFFVHTYAPKEPPADLSS